MIVLVPSWLHEELVPEAAVVAPEAVLLPFTEDATPVPDLDRAEVVFRWRGGLRFSEIVEAGPNVRWLHTESAGVDMVLTDAVRAKPHLIVTNSSPAYEIPIAEFVLSWMFAVAHRIEEQIVTQRARRWSGIPHAELHGQTVGVIGLGAIGQGVCTRAKAMGIRTLGLKRTPGTVAGVDEALTGPEGLDRLLSRSDFVVIAAPLTPETRGLLSGPRIARMKPNAWLINIARGAIVDEKALIRALQSGAIGGACLDVFAVEPLPQDSPLWDMPNVYITPHFAFGQTSGLDVRLKALFLANLRRFIDGEPLSNIVDVTKEY
ncbi:MAG: D-2-hydroxyacid dehydrogenase [Capsulimonadaceae bacterium]|nr:D-2-hydroxyacid dehydrogenase [Capsulimonadaceae bacterium]